MDGQSPQHPGMPYWCTSVILALPQYLKMAASSNSTTAPMSQKQLMKLQNRLKNEAAALAKLRLKTENLQKAPVGSGLSKGQRRRANAQKKIAGGGGGGSTMMSSPTSSKPGFASQVIRNDELIANVRGSDSFRTTGFFVNPGLPVTFPWLSSIAKQYEKYRFRTLQFYYKKAVSGFATAGQTGKVMLSLDYDALDPPPATKVQVMDTWPHVDNMPCETFGLSLSLTEMFNNGPKFVRTGNPPVGADIKTYDGGLLSVSTEGIGGVDAIVGELHVLYEVELLVPVLETVQVAPTNFNVSQYGSNPQTLVDGTPSKMEFDFFAQNGNALGLAEFTPQTGDDRGKLAGSVTDFLLPEGNYLVRWNCLFEGASTDITSATINCNLAQEISPSSYTRGSQGGFAGTTQTSAIMISGERFIASDGKVSFSIEAEAVATSPPESVSCKPFVTIHRV